MTKTFNVHEINKAEAEKKLESLNRKFAKHGVPLVSYSFGEKDETDVYLMTVEYDDVPSISGIDYKYLGSIHDEDGSKFFNFSDVADYEKIKNVKCTCDMCKKEISRNSFYVFEKKDDNSIAMFGSSCAKKAFPFDISFYLGNLELVFEDMEEINAECCFNDFGDKIFGGRTYFNIDRVIYTLANETNDFTRWVSKDTAEMERIMSTKECVLDELTRKHN